MDGEVVGYIQKPPVFDRRFLYVLDEASSFESLVGSVLGDSAETFCRNLDTDRLANLWNEDTLLLEIW